MVKRIFVEKKKGFDTEARSLLENLQSVLDMPKLKDIRVLYMYDIEGISEETYQKAKYAVFAKPQIDIIYEGEPPQDIGDTFFVWEYLSGQYDQKEDSAVKCINMLDLSADVMVSLKKVVALYGDLSKEDIAEIEKYCINPVDSRKVQIVPVDTIKEDYPDAPSVKVIDGFSEFNEAELIKFKEQMGLAMTDEDILFVQGYYKEEKRQPTVTELKVLDTYWSDHCRHSTFFTNLIDIQFDKGAEAVQAVFDEYMQIRKDLYAGKDKDVCLMDIACIGTKYLKGKGLVPDLDESDEVNACSIKAKVDIDGKEEDWLVMYKNETHNHPTEIEPLGGANTCLGGAIRDPLSGRVFVYQAMRVTGSADPRKLAKDTLVGKLPQRKITQEAALGYSTYGNQVGASSGQVVEIYDEGYVAKRMELGALVGAAPAENVRRAKPKSGDVVILVGGRTGRDGCGGATGSSKGHTEESSVLSGAEVQKGDPLTGRNLQNLFRRNEASTLIKKCNDFGAGGVSVAVGEIADSIDVNLDVVPVKYDGLDGTELAISESQERMAVVVSDADKEKFIAYAKEEDLEATVIATITDTGRFRMFWRGDAILDLSREFLDSNGVTQKAKVTVTKPKEIKVKTKSDLLESLSDINCASQKGLVERFDSASGGGSVLMPLGGKYQLTPAVGMAAKLPVLKGDTNTATLMTYGFNPEISRLSPFHGAMYAVMESVTKIAAMGGDISKVRLSFQEYFERMKNDVSFGKPFSALLGALKVQKELEIPALGGKDSMSGTFMDIDVPPTLVSFAINVCEADKIISPEFKKEDSKIVLISTDYDESGLPDFDAYKKSMKKVLELIKQKKILSANTVGTGGIFIALTKMAVGNKIGFSIKHMKAEELQSPDCTALIVEIPKDTDVKEMFAGIKYEELGNTTNSGELTIKDTLTISIEDAIKKWTAPLEEIFPTRTSDFKDKKDNTKVENISFAGKANVSPKVKVAKPKVLIPVFLGTNGEIDLMRGFEKAGAEVVMHNVLSLTKESRTKSIAELATKIKECQILAIAGGSAGGDESGGAGKYIAAILGQESVKDAIMELLEARDGLILGIENGFQGLIELGLLPHGKITTPNENSPVLTFNKIGKAMSSIVNTRITSVKSPWFAGVSVGDIHAVSLANSEGRFFASDDVIKELADNGQIAAQYVDFDGNASMDIDFNPSYSAFAIEAITSPDGRIMGKMTHAGRIGENLYKNASGNYEQKIFESGVKYFNY